MPDDDAFLRAIGAAPTDDAPRLVYADWLEERGDAARAEFIRVQCELARPGGERGRRTELRLRERELLKAHKSDWARPFKPWFDEVEFRRGFVEVIAGSADKLERLPSHLFAPGIVQEVRVTGPLRPTTTVRGFTQMHGVKTLRLCSLALTSADLIDLGMAEQFAALEALDLRWNDITTDGFRELLAEDFLPRGRSLLLGGNHFGADYRAELSEVFGDRVSFAVERSADHLYSPQAGSDRMTGLTADGRQVVLVRHWRTPGQLVAFYFDLDGSILEAEQHILPQRRAGTILDNPAVRTFAARLGLKLGPIAIRRFQHAETGYRLSDFLPGHGDLIQSPPPHPDDPDQQWRCNVFRALKYEWMPRGDSYFGELPE